MTAPLTCQAIKRSAVEQAVDDSGITLSLRITIDSGSKCPMIGLALVEGPVRRLHVGATIDADTFATLATLAAQYQPDTVLLAVDRSVPSYLQNRINHALKAEAGLDPRVHHLDYYAMTTSESDVIQALDRLLQRDESTSALLLSQRQPSTFHSISAALSHCGLVNSRAGSGQWRLLLVDLASHFTLDSSAMKALNLFPPPGATREPNLFFLLNQGRTAMASRLLKMWLMQPLLVIDQIERRQSLISALMALSLLRSDLRDGALKRIPDADKVIRLFQLDKARLQQVVVLWQFTERLLEILAALRLADYRDAEQYQLVHANYIAPLERLTRAFEGISKLVHRSIDLDAINQRHEFVLNAQLTPALAALDAKKRSLRRAMGNVCTAFATSSGMVGKVRIEVPEAAGSIPHLRCSVNDQHILPERKILELGQRSSKYFGFTTKEFRSLALEYQQIVGECERVQTSITKQLIAVVNSYLPMVEEAAKLVGEIDLVTALAVVFTASPKGYVRPTVLPFEAQRLSLQQARHPVMESLRIDSAIYVIPNDVEFEGDTRRTLILTGPNMSGKSSFIRMVGVIQLMAQCGLWVPCDAATLSLRNHIFTRIGAGDVQSKGVSTFFLEMSEVGQLLAQATPHSLVIIDELGRGTSTRDGLRIGAAVIEYLSDTVQCTSMIATHYHELTELEADHRGIANAHCEVLVNDANDSILMTYHVLPGAVSQSYGVQCCAMAKLPREIIENARRKLQEFETEGEQHAYSAVAAVKQESAESVALGGDVVAVVTPEEEALLRAFLRTAKAGRGSEFLRLHPNAALVQAKLIQARDVHAGANGGDRTMDDSR